MDNARRGARYLIRMPVALTSGRNNVQLMTKNISMHGLFIETDQPPALGYFVVVRLSLPDDLVLSMSGMVIPRQPNSARTWYQFLWCRF